jgi:hypothetical protein
MSTIDNRRRAGVAASVVARHCEPDFWCDDSPTSYTSFRGNRAITAQTAALDAFCRGHSILYQHDWQKMVDDDLFVYRSVRVVYSTQKMRFCVTVSDMTVDAMSHTWSTALIQEPEEQMFNYMEFGYHELDSIRWKRFNYFWCQAALGYEKSFQHFEQDFNDPRVSEDVNQDNLIWNQSVVRQQSLKIQQTMRQQARRDWSSLRNPAYREDDMRRIWPRVLLDIIGDFLFDVSSLR